MFEDGPIVDEQFLLPAEGETVEGKPFIDIPQIQRIEPKPEVKIRPRKPTYPKGAEYVAGKPAPEGLVVEHKPILRKTVKGDIPWKTMAGAENALKSEKLKSKGISFATHKIVEAPGGGYQIVKIGEEGEVKPKIKSKIIKEVPKERKIYKKTLAEVTQYENTDLFLSSELEELHNHKARTLGFKKAGRSFVEGFLKKLAQLAEKVDMSLVTATYDALNKYEKGNANQALVDAELILGKVHEAEIKALTPEKMFELHKKDIYEALKSGELTPEKYAELHEKDYGPLAEFISAPQKIKMPIAEWDALSHDAKVKLAKKAKLVTKDGTLTVQGEKIIKSKWRDLSKTTQKMLSRHMEAEKIMPKKKVVPEKVKSEAKSKEERTKIKTNLEETLRGIEEGEKPKMFMKLK